MAILLVAGAEDQTLVLFYAVSVFISFLAGLLAMSVTAHKDKRQILLVANVAGAVVVTFVLVLNLARIYPLASLAATVLIASGLYVRWVNAGRPRGVSEVEAEGEAFVGEEETLSSL